MIAVVDAIIPNNPKLLSSTEYFPIKNTNKNFEASVSPLKKRFPIEIFICLVK